jgi:hypothetical protein
MKRIILTLAALLCFAGFSQAQTSAQSQFLQEAWNDVTASTNFALVAFYGRGLTGNKSVAGADYIYNLTHNEKANAAILIGGDFLWAKGTNDANVVRGGLNISYKLYPFQQFGLTNFYGTVYLFDTIASPIHSDLVGNVAGTGLDFKWNVWKALDVHIGGMYANRSGQGRWDGNYLAAETGLSWKF